MNRMMATDVPDDGVADNRGGDEEQSASVCSYKSKISKAYSKRKPCM